MNKELFLGELEKKLSGLGQDEIRERISFYSEMIDDRMEDGISEEEAIAAIGTADEIAAQIMSEIPLSRLVREKAASVRKNSAGNPRKAWKNVLLTAGSVVWVPLLIAAFAVLLSLYISLWAVVISLYAVFAALAASAVCSLPLAVLMLVRGNFPGALGAVGLGAFCAGLSILMFFACKAVTKGVLRLTKKLIYRLKTLFIRKGGQIS